MSYEEVFRRGKCALADLLAHETGHEVTNMDSTACYYRSREICLDGEIHNAPGNNYVYFEERRNGNEHHIGYSLAYCLVDPNLPDKLSDEGESVVEYFRQAMNGSEMFWENGASIGNAYTRGLARPEFERRFTGPKP